MNEVARRTDMIGGIEKPRTDLARIVRLAEVEVDVCDLIVPEKG